MSSSHALPRRPLLVACAGLFALALLAWTLPQDAPRGRSGVVRPAQEEPVELVDHMLAMKKQLKALATGLSEGKPTAELLAHVNELQTLTMKGKTFAPTNLDEQPAKRRDAHQAAFRADMARLLIELAHLEIDLLEGRPEEAFGRVTGSLFKLREASHEKYQKP